MKHLVLGFGYKDITDYCTINNLYYKDIIPITYGNLDGVRGVGGNCIIHVTIDPLILEECIGINGVKEYFLRILLLKRIGFEFYDNEIFKDYYLYAQSFDDWIF